MSKPRNLSTLSTLSTLYRADQTRELDRIAIQDFGISGFTLMQRAAQATFDAMLNSYPDCKSVCVLSGAGNNGGDGYVIATLAIKAGLKTTLIQQGDINAIQGDALLAKDAFTKAGGISTKFDETLLNADVIVDAILGTGLTRNVKDDWLHIFDVVNQSSAKKVAVDIPSGLSSDTGQILGACIKADLTVTYIGLKRGLFTGQARGQVGQLIFNDLGVPTSVYEQLSKKSNTYLIPQNIITNTIKPRPRCSHKGNFGSVLLIGGGEGMSGAIRLAAEACLRSGAGLVHVATHPSHAHYINATRPEMMVKGVEEPHELDELLAKVNTIVLGPGLGKSQWARDLFTYVVNSNHPMIIDADALNLLSETPIKKDNWILTPHPKEASRLLNITAKEIESDRYSNIEKMQQKYGGVSILKGAGSLINNGSETFVCTNGNPGMSSGGMGDVLSGIIGALVAQGIDIFDAATIGVELHAQAADLAAENGEIGMLASDLFPHLRTLLNNKLSAPH
ncbi:NAD(P)H-hydrate dehydratase [uncultured Cocleimonas sp.]|uniref:NAD(P)H-hydrate dehydratase n=1 Tax=uncultured Cocleimonas sp. TaxID=1051587 RepID=UPI002624F347|nr:NAD(P)H-hydrate dehydratase [uncultured Cocleimonas sp.]